MNSVPFASAHYLCHIYMKPSPAYLPLYVHPEGVEEEDGIVICSLVDIRPARKDFLQFSRKNQIQNFHKI
ncbi:unnamed protein product [Allacma fusca]|uniref:Uncharacterized protein n=1 Tax=Allacma fusca TaxID=39272 RepID=A0A8J2JHX0_9HEXA|nr:unnamed protein product [Allacma fusca]